jgi:hypothetical protein
LTPVGKFMLGIASLLRIKRVQDVQVVQKVQTVPKRRSSRV